MKRNKKPECDDQSKQAKLTQFFTTPVHIKRVLGENKDAENTAGSSIISTRVQASTTSAREPVNEVKSEVKNVAVAVGLQPGKRKFREEWCKELSWLTFDKTTGVAQCKSCVLFPNSSDQSSKVVTGFTGPFKLETFKKHDKSLQHRNCVAACNTALFPETTPLAVCVKKMDSNMFENLKKLFNIAYYIAKNNKPFTDFPGLIELSEKLGVELREEYGNRTSCKEFISQIAKVLRSDLISELKDASCVTLLLDGSADSGSVEELILYVRFVRKFKIKETFLSLTPLESGSAAGYMEALEKELEKLGISEWLSGSKLVGIGTDGAASLLGAQNGLIHNIRQKVRHIVAVHCIAHRLQLSVLSSVKHVDYVDELDSLLKSLYKFYQQSPKRLRELKTVAESLEMRIRKFQYLHSVRWVASKVGCVSALVTDWKCVIVHLENVIASKDKAAPVAKGLLRKITDYKFVHMLHFFLDFLEIMKNLSLLFQREQLFLSTIELHVKCTVTSLELLKITPGPNEDKFLTNTSINGVFQEIQLKGAGPAASSADDLDKEKLISHSVRYLKERFLVQGTIEKCTTIFDTFAWPTGTDLENYGIGEISMLAEHFREQLANCENSGNYKKCIQNEWYEFKVLGRGKHLYELLELASSDRFPILGQLLSIVCILPVSTASCERGFSQMNLIKDRFRSSLETDILCDLMMCNMNGPAVKEFDPARAVDQWYFSSKTTRHIHGHKRPCKN